MKPRIQTPNGGNGRQREGTAQPSRAAIKHAFHLRSILVPIDFSECSEKALAYAVPYAEQFKANLILLYVADFFYSDSTGPDDFGIIERKYIENASGRLKGIIAEQVPRSVKAYLSVRAGKPYQEIVATAAREDANLIIMSTQGCGPDEHRRLGSTTEKVVRYAGCPVLVVRQKEKEFIDTEKSSE